MAGRGGSWLGRVVALLVVVAACGALVVSLGQRRARRIAEPVSSGRLPAAGLEAPVEVLRDRRGVPHIAARSEADAYLALGFVHAQDRLAQMVWLRRQALGRVAELVGEEALDADRRARVLGFGHLAAADLAVLPAADRALLEAYAAGVNARLARIASGEQSAPPELRAWGAVEGPWAAADSLAILKHYAWALGGSLDESLVLADLVERFGGFEAAVFFPRGVGMGVLPAEGEGRVAAGLSTPTGSAAVAPLRRRAGLLGPSIGSSVFVVGGRHTRSGRPLLAADTHLAPTIPPLVHQAHIRAPGLEVAGAAIPGLPVFWSGFNGRVAWASSHARALVADLVVESLREAPPRYHDGEGWVPLPTRVEQIAVRGKDPVRLEVRATGNGPLVNEVLDRDREPLALRWTGSQANAGLGAFLAVTRARSAGQLVEALRTHHEPFLAVGYVDSAGAAGIQLAGAAPERQTPSGLLPVPGRTPSFAWRGRLAPSVLPAQRIRDGTGFEVASDGRPGSDWRGAAIEWMWLSGERAARLETMLYRAIGRDDLDLRALAEMQTDLRDERAGAVVTLALERLGDRSLLAPEERRIAQILEDWDRSTAPESVGAAVYHVFLRRLVRALFEPRMGAELLRRYLDLGRTQASELVHRVMVTTADPALEDTWSDPGTVGRAVERSLQGTWLELSHELGANRDKWTWGRLHSLRFRPPWPDIGSVGDMGPLPYGGNGASVLLGDYRALESFEVSAIASYRFLVDAEDLSQGLTSLAPGQSEHLAHENARDGMSRWLLGRHSLLSLSWLAAEEAAVAQLLLEPASGPGREP